MGWLNDEVNKAKAIVSDPGQAIQNVVNTAVKDTTNVANAAGSLISNPSVDNLKKITAQTLANPLAPAIAGAALTAVGVPAPLAAGIVGGTEYLATNSASKGVMAGIGAYGGSNLFTDVSAGGSAAIQGGEAGVDSTTGQNFVAGLSNPSEVLAAASSSPSVYKDALALGSNVVAAANGPNGNLITSGLTGNGNPQPTASGTAAGSDYTATVGGNPSGQYYNRNPIPASQLNLIGAQYVPGENPDTSERTYFQPSYSTAANNMPVTTGSPTTYTPQQAPTNPNPSPSPGTLTQTAGAGTPPPNLTGAPTISSIAAANPQLSAILSAGSQGGAQRPQMSPEMLASIQQPVPVMRAAMGGLQNTPQAILAQQPTPASIPMSYNLQNAYHRPYAQDPVSQSVTGMAEGGLDHHAHMAARKSIASDPKAQGYNLGSYSDGGRLLKGPGDGVSDSIPATIGHKQPARLADGEFVVPARHVSELGNGSTEAGARKLYAMLDRIQSARAKTVGKKKGSIDSKADKYLPA